MAVSFLEGMKSDHGSEIEAVRQSSFRVNEIKNPLSRRNAISVALNAPLKYNNLGEDQDLIRSWHSKYVENLLRNLEEFPELFDTSKWKVKLYTHGESLEILAPGLIKELQGFDFLEIHCMAHDSPLLSPGTLWRFLSLSDQTLEQLLILDIDESWQNDVDHWYRLLADNQQPLTRAHHIPRKGFWLNLMNPWGIVGGKAYNYLPLMASKVMARPALLGLRSVDFLMSAYIVLRKQRVANGFPCTQVADDEPITPHNSPYHGMPYGFGNHWNGYCFDERFLAHVVFHHAVKMGGLCTFCLDRFRVDDLPTYLQKYNLQDFLSDYEYVQSTSPSNTIIHRGSSVHFLTSPPISESDIEAVVPEPSFIAVRPIGDLSLPGEVRGIIPDISFHPSGKMFAVTTWADNRILIYGFANAPPVLRQVIEGDVVGFKNAHSIAFTPSADRMIVNSYRDNSFVVFDVDTVDFSVDPIPAQIFETPGALQTSYPHSMDITQDGKYLACVYCDGDRGFNKIVIYRLDRNQSRYDFGVVAVLEGEHFEYANPKGIAFTPDNRGILVTLSDTNNLVLYDFDPESAQLDADPRQILRNPESRLAHPEDISFSACESYFMVSNAGENNIGIYGYDQQQRRIINIEPVFNFGQPEVALNYPHGLDISPDGRILAVTDYGYYAESQQIVNPLDQPAKVAFYEISHQTEPV
ncbi:MAG: DNA-binding beta-propeller fold protein YncE [Parasphingorhabdus sp.]